jgi:hypothetical protein
MQVSALPSEPSEAAKRGWCLLPVQARGKRPLIKAWPQAATCAVEKIEVWARHFPNCNWGVATGMRSGIFILDIDGPAGEDALRVYARTGCHVPTTLGVLTGNGRHLYFRYPVGSGIRNSAGKLSRGLDIRGNGGFAVLPPSVHETGTRYSYQEPSLPVADAPTWLLELICVQRSATASVLHEGFRNDGLARVAGRWRRRGATVQEITTRLLKENLRLCDPPLQEPEVVKIAKSVARYPVGGPDVLDLAWEKVRLEDHDTTEAKFCAIVRYLAEALPGKPVALPLERIAGHIGCNWTLIRRYRRRAIERGLLQECEPCIPHRKAALYEVIAHG